MQTPLELTEEIRCFTDLRKNLTSRKRKAEREREHTKGAEGNYGGSREENLHHQLKVVERHLLKCFVEREEIS